MEHALGTRCLGSRAAPPPTVCTSPELRSYLPFPTPPCAITVTSFCLGNNCYNVRGSRVLLSASSWGLGLAVQPVTSQGGAGTGHHSPGPGRDGAVGEGYTFTHHHLGAECDLEESLSSCGGTRVHCGLQSYGKERLTFLLLVRQSVSTLPWWDTAGGGWCPVGCTHRYMTKFQGEGSSVTGEDLHSPPEYPGDTTEGAWH